MSNRIVKLPSVESFGRLTPDKRQTMNGDVTAMDINCALASRYRRDGDGYWSEIFGH